MTAHASHPSQRAVPTSTLRTSTLRTSTLRITSPGVLRLSEDLQDGGASAQALDIGGATRRDRLDVTSVLVFFVVTVGLFLVPLGATLLQNEAVAAVVESMQ